MALTPVSLAAAYLRAVRHDEAVAATEDAIASLNDAQLAAALSQDRARTAFWLNVYNAAVQARLRENPDRLRGLSRLHFFRRPAVTIAGHALSPNDVEHGLLRGSRLAVGLGYLPRPLPDAFERAYRVRDLDPRVHFALNCGAASCPAIAAYEADSLDSQLDLATRAYLEESVTYDPRKDLLTVPRLFLWYRGDFDGPAGTVAFLDAHDTLPPGASVGSRLRHASYDWSLDLGAFREARA